METDYKKSMSKRHTKTVMRRLDYLKDVIASGDGNSYDASEVSGLEAYVRYVTTCLEYEERLGMNLFDYLEEQLLNDD